MKIFSKLFLSCLFLCITIFSIAQVPHKIIKLNYDSKKGIYIDTSKKNKIDLNSKLTYSFKLKGINTTFQKVEFKGTFYRKKTSLPEQLKAYIPIVTSQSEEIPVETFYLPSYELTKNDETSLKIKNAATTQKDIYQNIQKQYKMLVLINNYTREAIKDTINLNGKGATLETQVENLFSYGYDVEDVDNLKIKDSVDLIINKIYLDFTTNVFMFKKLFPLQISNYDTLFNVSEMQSSINDNKKILLSCPTITTALKNNKSEKKSIIYEMGGDYLSLKVSFVNNNFLSKPDTISKTLFFYKKNYWKFSFSGGFFLHNLGSPNYTYTNSNGSYQNNINSNLSLSIGALVHFNYVACSSVKIGPVAGASISLFDAKTIFLLGGGITLGRKSEVCISGGLSVANYAHVTPDYNTASGTYTPGKSVPTYDKPKCGGFVGITYTIFSK